MGGGRHEYDMCRKTPQGRRAHATTGNDMLLRRDATKACAHARHLPKGPPTGHDKALRRDAIQGERIYKALAIAPRPGTTQRDK